MKKEKEKSVDVKINDDQTVKIIVRKPSSKVLTDSQRISAKVWNECVRDKIMTKQELNDFMKKNGIWSAEKDAEQLAITQEINKLEKKLYLGDGKDTLKTSEAKDIALQMRLKRLELRNLIAEKLSLEQNTAEALADNARFDYIVANSTFYENGQRVYNSMDDYNNRSDEEIAFSAASAMAQLLYSIDKDFEANLPENKFLINHQLVNQDLSLINDKGETVDLEGRLINEDGFYINSNGQRIDIDGNLLDENGNYIPSVIYEDDIKNETNTASQKPKKEKKAKSVEING